MNQEDEKVAVQKLLRMLADGIQRSARLYEKVKGDKEAEKDVDVIRTVLMGTLTIFSVLTMEESDGE